MLALLAVPETVHSPDRVFRLRLQVGVPARMRLVMLGAMLGIFAAFTVAGLFSSLVPSFLSGILGCQQPDGHRRDHVFDVRGRGDQPGAVGGPAAGPQVGELGPAPAVWQGQAALEGSLFARALWLFLAGTVVSGIAVGLVFRGGLSEISRLAEPGRRAEAMSAFAHEALVA
jgi:hypothetical protein